MKNTAKALSVILAACLAAPAFSLESHSEAKSVEGKPNIIVVLADDMGYGDVSSYNPESKIPTPHIDRLANEGMKFTDGHLSSAVCTPTPGPDLANDVPVKLVKTVSARKHLK